MRALYPRGNFESDLGTMFMGRSTSSRARIALVAVLTCLAHCAQAADHPVQVVAAGSLKAVMTALIAGFKAGEGAFASPIYGPSGGLRSRIEAGEAADLFASADMEQPRRLAARRSGSFVVEFTRNKLCAIAPRGAKLSSETLLEHLLDPSVRVGTSTPGSDPSGDYAWMMFAKAESVRPGAKATLEAKALKLVGAPDSKPLVEGHTPAAGIFLANRADVFIAYCSGRSALQAEMPDLDFTPIPATLAPEPAYGMIALSENPTALRFGLFVMSEPGQALLEREGFAPLSPPAR